MRNSKQNPTCLKSTMKIEATDNICFLRVKHSNMTQATYGAKRLCYFYGYPRTDDI